MNDILKVALPVVLTALASVLFVSQRQAKLAAEHKKYERQVLTLDEFETLYGQFITNWRKWTHACSVGIDRQARRWALLGDAAAAEGRLEALLVKVALDRTLANYEVETMGRFRRGYQCLRLAIDADRELNWSRSHDSDYLIFKILACQSAAILGSWSKVTTPPRAASQKAILGVTSDTWDDAWNHIAKGDRLVAELQDATASLGLQGRQIRDLQKQARLDRQPESDVESTDETPT